MQLRIENADNTTDTLTASASRITRSLDEQDRAEVDVYRDEWMAIEDDLVPRTAKLYLDVGGVQEFGGRLDDTDTQDETVRVRINSPEIDAAEAEPTGENVIYNNTGDDVIVTDQIQAVPTLTAGTVTQQAPSVSYSASFASRSKVLYDLRAMTGSEFAYRSDFTVDYVDRLGSDKSGSITLGPANQNIGQQFSKKIDVRENVTHVQGLGAQSGPDQVQATGVAASYTSGRKIWKRYENKEVYQQSRLQSIVDKLANEYDGEPRSLEVTCTAYPEQIGTDIGLGDTVQVTYPEEDINRTLRIKKLIRRFSESAGHVLDLTLSNRFLTRENRNTKRNDDLQRFNRGHQGFVDRDNDSYGWQPVSDTQNATRPYYYPDDVVTEERAVVSVKSIKYRSFVGAAGHSHSVSVTHPQHSHDVSGTTAQVGATNLVQDYSNTGTGTGTVDLVSLSSRGFPTLVYARMGVAAGSSGSIQDARLYAIQDEDQDGIADDTFPIAPSEGATFATTSTTEGVAYIPEDGTVGSIGLTVQTPSTTNSPTVQWEWGVYRVDPHSHGISETSSAELGTTTSETSSNEAGFAPGINEYNETVSGADLIVNGTTVASNIGSGAFSTDVDVSGHLTAGDNTIELASDALGMVNLTVQTELFRRGPQSN